MLIRHTIQDGKLAAVDCALLCPDRGSLRHVEDSPPPAHGPAHSARPV